MGPGRTMFTISRDALGDLFICLTLIQLTNLVFHMSPTFLAQHIVTIFDARRYAKAFSCIDQGAVKSALLEKERF